MLRFLARTALALAVLFCAAAAGFVLATRLAPERLQAEIESQLGRALGTPVSLKRVRLSLGRGVELSGEAGRVWGNPLDPSLYVHEVQASVDLFGLLRGRFHLNRLVLEGARLRVERLPGAGDGGAARWSPPPVAELARRDPSDEARPHEVLSPLIALEGVVRALLSRPLVADALEIRDASIRFIDHVSPAGQGAHAPPRALSLERVQVRLDHRTIGGGARLTLRARAFSGSRALGKVEWVGSRGRAGELRMALAATGLELEPLGAFAAGALPGSELAGTLTGALAYETVTVGAGALELDLVFSGLEARFAPGSSPISAEHAETLLTLSIDPQSVRLERARVSSGDLDLHLEGTVERPLSAASQARLAVSFRDVELAETLEQLGWLPRAAERSLDRVEAGRLVRLTARGVADLAGWRGLFSGRTERLPEGFAVDAEIEHAQLRVGKSDRLEEIGGLVTWSGDQVLVRGATAQLDGSALPVLDLTLDGVSNLFASDPRSRELGSGGEPLEGLDALWRLLRPEQDPTPNQMGTGLELDIERLEHPMFLWPLADLHAEIAPQPNGVHITASRGTWAGVPIRAEADWRFEPEQHLAVSIRADPPGPDGAPPEQPGGWARGRFAVGPIRSASWRQASAHGAFAAAGSTVLLREVVLALEPSGELRATGTLDLGVGDEVPVQLSFVLEDGDVGALTELAGVDPGLLSGQAALSGAFEGRLRAERPFFEDVAGSLTLRARDGGIRRGIPAILAIALASEAFNPFAKRDTVRFREVATTLAFADGSGRTEALMIDGPDLRLIASGSLDVAREPHQLDAEVALFLFRQVDRVIERIPLVNLLLLGDDESIMAAYYEVSGPWAEPDAKLFPLRTLASGPASLFLERVPNFVRKSFRALGSMLEGEELEKAERRRPGPRNGAKGRSRS